MSVTNGPNLGLMENANTGEAHDTALRTLLRGLDGLVMPNAKGYLTNTPPGSPANGDLYIIGAAPTGAWAGQGGKVTRYSTVAAAWEFYTPKNGWMIQANSARETYRYTGGAWEIYYQEGTWTPTLTNLTIIGTPTYTGRFTRIGRIVNFQLRVQSTTSTAAGAGATFFGLPVSPGGITASASLTAVAGNASASYGIGLISTDGNAYPPTWAANSDTIINATYAL